MTLSRPSRHVLALAGSALAALALAGCGNGVTSSHGGTGTALSTPTASPTPPAPASSTTPSGGSTGASTSAQTSAATATTRPGPAGPAMCAVNSLRVGSKAPAGGASAGSSYLLLTFRNVSSARCTMDGYPGVSFVGKGNGTQLGSPAVRTGGQHTIALAPGATTTALLQIANAGDYDAATCEPATADGLRVYPPGSRASVYVPFRTQACQATGLSSPQLSVSAVGSATGG